MKYGSTLANMVSPGSKSEGVLSFFGTLANVKLGKVALLKTPLSNAELSRENRELKKQAKHLRNSNKILERENGKLRVTSEADKEGRAKAEAEVIRLKAALEKATQADRVVKFGREKCFS